MIVALFVLTFLESIAATLIQRGLYFLTNESYGFTQTHNLWIAFGFGVAYVGGAYVSHSVARRIGEKALLVGSIAALLALHVLMALVPTAWVLVCAVCGTAVVQGAKWPVVESYISAGRAPKQLLTTLSRYNVTWASAGFLAIGVTGAIVGTGRPALFFWFPAALNVVALMLALTLPAKLQHLDQQHPARPAGAELAHLRSLLGSARWSMTSSYALFFVLAPLMPSLLAELELPVTAATPVASILDGVRVAAFGALGAFGGWHGKRAPLWLIMVALPASFLLILFGQSLPAIVAGEVLFGSAAGFAYTASLYYALVAENASVDAGGTHETLIGIGIGLGPLSGLLGQSLAGRSVPLAGHLTLAPTAALALTLLPFVGVCVVGSLRSLVKPPGRPA
jgi:predicted MFS family arabinose efflux permease